MTKEKRYESKRQQIQDILEKIEVDFETDECYHSGSVQWDVARKNAEIILAKFGINKPNTLK